MRVIPVIPDRIERSARITAGAWGVAYIGITRTTEQGVGGRWYVTREPGAGHYSGQPLERVAEIRETPDGTLALIYTR